MKKIIPLFLLGFFFFLSFFSALNDSLTFDEPAHIGAGYAYLVKRDYRLNPEHPPLAKDIAAFPLIFLKLKFPGQEESWQQNQPAEWWAQFDFGKALLYKANDPQKIIFWSKLMMIFLSLLTGLTLFLLTKKFFGYLPALLTLFFFCFSPTFLAHGRLVTTDVAASLGVIVATFFYLNFLYQPTKKNLILAGLMLGLALLAKFSLILLLIYLFILTIIFVFLKYDSLFNKDCLKAIFSFLIVNLIAFCFVIFPVYQYHISNYPHERQIRDAIFNLEKLGLPKFAKQITIAFVQNKYTRAWGQYLLGLSMAVNRTAAGNTMFFMGEISSEGWRSYFPIVFLLKEPLSFHILLILSFVFFLLKTKDKYCWELKNNSKKIKSFLLSHFSELALFVFIFIYAAVSLSSKLNLGVRHLLPSFPFLYILASLGITKILKPPQLKMKYLILGALLFFQVFSVVRIFPHFLSYFNELIGGSQNGYLYTTDSNLDWGQDLKRLALWVEKNKIEKIYVDYFGGGSPEYYLKERYIPWNGQQDPHQLKKPAFLAVSVNSLQSGRALPGKKFNKSTDFYYWLYQYEPPIAKIGYSIFVYFISK